MVGDCTGDAARPPVDRPTLRQATWINRLIKLPMEAVLLQAINFDFASGPADRPPAGQRRRGRARALETAQNAEIVGLKDRRRAPVGRAKCPHGDFIEAGEIQVESPGSADKFDDQSVDRTNM